MKCFAALFVAALVAAAGCNDAKSTFNSSAGSKGTGGESDVTANLGKLAAEDRALAEAQRLCPVTDEPLGSMGVPIKLDIKGQPVLICCKACQKKAERDPDATLAKLAELKNKTAAAKAGVPAGAAK